MARVKEDPSISYDALAEKLPETLSDLQKRIIDKMLTNPKVTYLQLASITGKLRETIR